MNSINFKKLLLETLKTTLTVYLTGYILLELWHLHYSSSCFDNFLSRYFCSQYDSAMANILLYSALKVLYITVKTTGVLYKDSLMSFAKRMLNR